LLKNAPSFIKIIFSSIITISFGFLIFKCESRSGLLGALLGLSIFIFRKETRSFVLASIIILFTYLIWNPAGTLHYFEIDWSKPAELLGRLVIWKTALISILDKPILGFGLGNFERAYFLNQQPTHEILRFEKFTQFAHNDYLQLAVEGGIPLLLIFLWGIIRLIIKVSRQKEISLIQCWALSTVILFGTISLFNFSAYLPTNGLILSGCLGLLFQKGLKDESQQNWSINLNFLKAISISMGLIVFGFGLSNWQLKKGNLRLAVGIMPANSEAWLAKAQKEAQESAPLETLPEVLRDLDKSILWNSENPWIWLAKGSLLKTLTPTPVNEIYYCLDKSISLAPNHAPFWILKGLFLAKQNNFLAAEKYFKIAADLEPRAPIPFYYLGLVSFSLNKWEEGRTSLNKAAELKRIYGEKISQSHYAKFLFNVTEEQISSIKNMSKSNKRDFERVINNEYR